VSYLVLARKFRPQTFDEVIGQEHVTTTLKNAILQGRVHHAFLFSGVRGTGKTTTARILAKALNCEKGPTPQPCGVCESCKQIAAGTSVDVMEIDGASHTGVDDIRNLRETVGYLPTLGRQKIYIIDEVHMLSTSAFNALLKTLEEPPAHVTFIFATTEPQKIPATIISRCQRFDFHRVIPEQIRDLLVQLLDKEGIEADPSALQLLAEQAGGSVRDSLSLLDQIIAYAAGNPISRDLIAEVLGLTDRSALAELTEALIGHDPETVLDVVENAFRSGWNLVQLARSLVAHIRDLVVVKLTKNPQHHASYSDEELAQARALVADTSPDRLLQLFDGASRAAEDISRSEFQKATAEMRLVELAMAESILPMGQLIDRLERLELRLSGRDPGSGRSGGSTGAQRPDGRPQRSGRNANQQPPREDGSKERAKDASTSQSGAKRAAKTGRQAKSSASNPGDTDDDPDRAGHESAPNDQNTVPAQEVSVQETRPDRARTPGQTKDEAPPAAPDDPERLSGGSSPSATETSISKASISKAGKDQQPRPNQPNRMSEPNQTDQPNQTSEPDQPLDVDRWDDIVAAVQKYEPFLAATLVRAQLLDLIEDSQSVTIRLAMDQGYATDHLEAQGLDTLESLASGHLGKEVHATLEHFSDDDPSQDGQGDRASQSLYDRRKRQRQERDLQTKREAAEHPSVRSVLELLDAQIRDIKIL